MKLKNNFHQCLWILTYLSLLLRKIKKIFLMNYAIIFKKLDILDLFPMHLWLFQEGSQPVIQPIFKLLGMSTISLNLLKPERNFSKG